MTFGEKGLPLDKESLALDEAGLTLGKADMIPGAGAQADKGLKFLKILTENLINSFDR